MYGMVEKKLYATNFIFHVVIFILRNVKNIILLSCTEILRNVNSEQQQDIAF